jgi:hypothetical protein
MQSNHYRLASYGIFAVLIIFTLLTFQHYGISNDEEVQHVYGRLLLDFYQSGFQDQSAFHYKNLYLYGGLFDVIAALLEKANVLWLWDMRHLLSAVFGLLGLLGVYKIALTLGSERTGLIALIVLALTAAWTGAMFTHTKDIPFATCMTWALYYTILVCRAAPAIPLALSIKLGLAVGCALGMRIGGGFAVVYLVLSLMLASLVMAKGVSQRLQYLLKSSWYLLPAAGIAFVIMAIFWPWGVMSPSHPAEAIKAFSNFSFNMLTIDDGLVTPIGDVPRSYLLHYLLVRLPELFLLGLLSLSVLVVLNLNQSKQYIATEVSRMIIPLLVAVLFPLVFVLVDKPALYNGVRHFTFVIPPLAVLAAIGIDQTLAKLQLSTTKHMAYLVLCLGLALMTLQTLTKLHPYEYIFYNHLAGDTAKAEKQWESDYWSSSLREASKALVALPLPTQQTPYLVAVCAENVQGSAYLDQRFEVTKDWVAADFYMSSTNMNCDQVLQGDVIAKVERLDTVLAVVKDRRHLVGEARNATPAPR